MHESVTRYKATWRRKGQPASAGGTPYDRDFVWVEAECTVMLDTATDDQLSASRGWRTAEEIRLWPRGAEALMAWQRRDPTEFIACSNYMESAALLDACTTAGDGLTKEQAFALTVEERKAKLEKVLEQGHRRGLTAV